MDALKRELGAPPEAETTQLFQEVLRSRPIHLARAPVAGRAGGTPAPAAIADLHATASFPEPEAAPPTNLPAPTSELIGRAAALAEVTELVAVHRLVTLIGAGGIGKTRLGLEVARAAAAALRRRRVGRPELAPVPGTVAMALRLALAAGAESPERVASALGTKRLLLASPLR